MKKIHDIALFLILFINMYYLKGLSEPKIIFLGIHVMVKYSSIIDKILQIADFFFFIFIGLNTTNI